jgi:DNA-binding transcriptional LysR family regulator
MHPLLDNRIRTRLRVRHLELLDALGETLNVHKAAPRLNLSQPATSKLLKELEELYRTPLFERQPRGLRPTAAGETAIRRARLLLQEIGDALVETHLVATGASGRIRLGVVPAALPRLFEQVLDKANKQFPLLVVHVTEGPPQDLLASLKRKEIDAVLMRVSYETDQPPFFTESLYSESISLVVRSKHPLARKRRLKISDLSGQDWILPPESSPVRQEIDRIFIQAGLVRPSAWIESTSLLLTETAIAQRDFVAALPHSVAKLYETRGQIKILNNDFVVHMPPIGLVTRVDDLQPPHVKEFLAVVREALGA